MQLLAVSNYGVIDHISLNVSSLECDAEESSIAEPLTSNLTETLQRFRRTFRNEELDDLMAKKKIIIFVKIMHYIIADLHNTVF